MTSTYLIPNKHRGHNKGNPRTFRVRVTVSETVEASEEAQTERANGIADMLWRIRCASAQLAGKAAMAGVLMLCLIGCGERTQINPGADLAIYSGSPQWMFEHIPAGHSKATSVLHGYYSPADGSITISEQLHGWALARTFLHEFGHACDHQRPADVWELMARYQAPGFDFNFHPDQRDIERAREAARQEHNQ